MAPRAITRVTPARRDRGPVRNAVRSPSGFRTTGWAGLAWVRACWRGWVSGWFSSTSLRRAERVAEYGGIFGSRTVRVSWAFVNDWAADSARTVRKIGNFMMVYSITLRGLW